MGLSGRIFLLDENDGLHRLPNPAFEQMLQDPRGCRLARFAGARVRMAHLVVELRDRQPLRVVRATFHILSFDGDGYFMASVFDRQQRALVELAIAPVIGQSEGPANVVEAAERFVAQGGRWVPSRSLERRIEEAALGRLKCPRL
jgi:hypothetical protein